MSSSSGDREAEAAATSQRASHKHLRGSSAMLIGRMVALVLGLITQTVIVRSLTKEDYGSFAYVLSLLLLGSSIAKVGMDKALSRFVPLFCEQGDKRSAAGVIVLAFGSIFLVGGLLAGVTILVSHAIFSEGRVSTLLVFLAILAPVEAWENNLQKLLAIFARPRALMFRRHILGPLLKLAAAIPLLFVGGDVLLLAFCYLAARILGTAVSFLLTYRELEKAGLIEDLRRPTLPAREIFGYSLPLLAPDLTTSLRSSLVTIFLEFFHGAGALATFRAVLPLARLNLVVSDSFRLLYSPALSKLQARDERSEISNLYWSTAAWIALLTYPVAVVTVCFSEPLTVLMFGSRYRDASSVLAAMAAAEYINASFGLNSLTLQLLGRVRAAVTISLWSTLAAVVLGLLLIPPYGPLGGALSVVGCRLFGNALNQWALYREGTIRGMTSSCGRVYLYVVSSSAAFIVLQAWSSSVLFVGAVAAVTGFYILRTSSRILNIQQVFPELMHFAAVRLLIGITGEAK